MASSFAFGEDNGTASTPPRGNVRTTGITSIDLKSADDYNTTSYANQPITAGNNSYTKYIWGIYSGSFNQINTVKYNHLSGSFGAGFTLVAFTGASGFYATPSASTNAALIHNITATGNVSTTGLALIIGGTGLAGEGPEATGKSTSTSANPAYTSYIAIQLQTSILASAGNVGPYTLGLSWLEN